MAQPDKREEHARGRGPTPKKAPYNGSKVMDALFLTGPEAVSCGRRLTRPQNLTRQARGHEDCFFPL